MIYNNFAEKVKAEVADKMGGRFMVSLKKVCKNNGVILQGLLITEEGQSVSPTIYLDAFWELYQNGMSVGEIVKEIICIYKSNMPEEQISMDFFREFGKVRDRISFKLIHANKNAELLEQIPHVLFLDLAICFYYAYFSTELGSGVVLIYNSHVEMWNTSTAELMKLALVNTERIFGADIRSMEEILQEHFCENGEDVSFLHEPPMYVLSNQKGIYGAACLLYPGLLETLSGEWEANLFILPSSVHEVILLPDTGSEDCIELKQMVSEVNASQKEQEGVLSDHIYYYDRTKKQIEIY